MQEQGYTGSVSILVYVSFYVRTYVYEYVRMFCVCADSAVGRFVVPLVFCDDDVFSMFRGMPRAALIVTELGPRATLVRMRAVALAFSAPPVRLLFSLSPPSRSLPRRTYALLLLPRQP